MKEGKMNFNLLKIVISLFLIWTLKNYDDMGISDEPSENFFFIDKIPNVLNNRLLAKYNLHDKGGQTELTGMLSKNITYNQKNDEASGISTYQQLSKRRSNNLENYKKPYRQKHVKKKGLSKLDDKFEKNIFDKMDRMYKLAENRKNEKNSRIKVVFNTFGIKIIFFGLLPIIGLIFPALFDGDENTAGILNWCKKAKGDCDNVKCGGNTTIYDPEDTLQTIGWLSNIFFCVSFITVVLLMIYTFIKIIKYVGLKNGRDNMRAKEYFHVCKEVLSNK